MSQFSINLKYLFIMEKKFSVFAVLRIVLAIVRILNSHRPLVGKTAEEWLEICAEIIEKVLDMVESKEE